MTARPYDPKPIGLEHVELPADLVGLVERLAENAHEVWAQQRVRDGWTWGEARCDVGKHHPCLVPYGDLPDSEREYDRRVVVDTLRAIVAMGYEVRRTSTGTPGGEARDRAVGPAR